MSRREWTTGEVRRLAELRARGLSVPRCAAELGRTRGSVSGALFAHGLTRPAPPWKRRKGELTRLVVKVVNANGVTGAADVLGVSRQAVYAALSRANGGKA
jgi:hypothetical protein